MNHHRGHGRGDFKNDFDNRLDKADLNTEEILDTTGTLQRGEPSNYPPPKNNKPTASVQSNVPPPLELLRRPFRIPTMVNERTPAQGAQRPSSSVSQNPIRAPSPDDDLDFGRLQNLQGLGSMKSSRLHDPFRPPSSSSNSGHPRVGPQKMMSSRKQKASGVFNVPRSRPEHHLDPPSKAPKASSYQPPLPTFNSTDFSAPPTRYGEETFYTDPNKANTDLKDLLEGVMDDDEDKDEGAKDGEKEGDLDPKTGHVDGLKVKLLPHQVEGVEWMRGRELGPVKRGKVPKGGILADDMGLGKTLQTLTLILTNQKPSKDDKRWKKQFEAVEKTTLVVAPLALIRQWESEIVDKIAKSNQLKVCVHHGPQRTKKFKELALYDVVITTYNILVSEHGQSSGDSKSGCFGLHWWRVVLDEAHSIKNRNAKMTKACYALRAEYRWCLSGTPMQNNLDELQSLIKFLAIKPYDNLKEWKEHIDLPMKNGKGHIAIRRLHSLLRCFMKRRTKAILKEDGALNPGGKPTDGKPSETGFRVTERKVVTVSSELTEAERRFYNRLQARADRSMDAMMGGRVNYASALTLLLRMRQACNHPKLVAGKLDKEALSTDASQKCQDADVDDMADMFAGLGIEPARGTRSCRICGLHLDKEADKLGRDTCEDCHSDLALFDNTSSGRPSKIKKKKKKTKQKEKMQSAKAQGREAKMRSARISMNSSAIEIVDEAEGGEEEEDEDDDVDVVVRKASRRPAKRNAILDSDDEDEDEEEQENEEEEKQKATHRSRNRNAVLDSDDEPDDEGSWLVPEDQRGNVNLGKCGGSEDENADGGGDTLGLEDSEDEDEGDTQQSGLSSFIVDDDMPQRQDSYCDDGASSDDDSSISAITKQLASQTLDDKPSQETASAAASETEVDDDKDSDDDDDDDEESGSEYEHDFNSNKVLASSKIRELIKILNKEVTEHKFIVFSQFTSMLDLVEPFLKQEDLKYTRYDGSMRNDEREESLRRLRGDKDTRILLCSLKCGSLGLNLTAATRVVILEPFWNPFIEEQAIDRVHRLTQTIDVIVYKLTVQNTVEEKILALQEKKRQLAEQAIEGGMKKGALKLGLNEIIELFKPSSSHHPTHAEGYVAASDLDRRDSSMMTKRTSGAKKQESELYGRRW